MSGHQVLVTRQELVGPVKVEVEIEGEDRVSKVLMVNDTLEITWGPAKRKQKVTIKLKKVEP